MLELIAGLLIFLGLHSVRVFADGWRSRQIARLGDKGWKLSYTVLSLLGFALIIHGYGQARLAQVVLWQPLPGMNHLAALLTLVAFILLAAAYVPGNQIKARLGHPMLLGTKTWALAHLLANNTLADVLLFGGFLLWAVLCFRSSRQRDRAAGLVRPAGTRGRTLVAIEVGGVAWALFAFWGHQALIGIRPL
ncbi:NnrU family protein [Pelomonas sp. V22]|uniref:NnrU family protein n=1 Tax=Pelomonas sp. V22 TaxID=2822139 RepID=UPI0024A9A282|nr:NnrU family protein [Pelomonas sp. V22]MDI4634296.1 NnrU family protein [Pelomonas sp. V22]